MIPCGFLIVRAWRLGLKKGNFCQVLELPNKGDKILDLQWEPHGNRFAVLHGEGPRPNFSLYGMKDMRTAAKVVQLLGTQTGKQANCIFWSPQARAPISSLVFRGRCDTFLGVQPAHAQDVGESDRSPAALHCHSRSQCSASESACGLHMVKQGCQSSCNAGLF